MVSEWAQIQLPNCNIIIFLKRKTCEVSDYCMYQGSQWLLCNLAS